MKLQNIIGYGIILGVIAIIAGTHWTAQANKRQVYTVMFERGTTIDPDDIAIIDVVVARMMENDHLEAVIVGHTGTRGDRTQNAALSNRRSEFIAKAMEDLGISEHRLSTFGAGDTNPLSEIDGEHPRAYQKRLSRAEIVVTNPNHWGW